MSEFRGSRRLMARLYQQRQSGEANHQHHTFSEEEALLRERLNLEAKRSFTTATPTLVKQAPKPGA